MELPLIIAVVVSIVLATLLLCALGVLWKWHGRHKKSALVTKPKPETVKVDVNLISSKASHSQNLNQKGQLFSSQKGTRYYSDHQKDVQVDINESQARALEAGFGTNATHKTSSINSNKLRGADVLANKRPTEIATENAASGGERESIDQQRLSSTSDGNMYTLDNVEETSGDSSQPQSQQDTRQSQIEKEADKAIVYRFIEQNRNISSKESNNYCNQEDSPIAPDSPSSLAWSSNRDDAGTAIGTEGVRDDTESTHTTDMVGPALYAGPKYWKRTRTGTASSTLFSTSLSVEQSQGTLGERCSTNKGFEPSPCPSVDESMEYNYSEFMPRTNNPLFIKEGNGSGRLELSEARVRGSAGRGVTTWNKLFKPREDALSSIISDESTSVRGLKTIESAAVASRDRTDEGHAASEEFGKFAVQNSGVGSKQLDGSHAAVTDTSGNSRAGQSTGSSKPRFKSPSEDVKRVCQQEVVSQQNVQKPSIVSGFFRVHQRPKKPEEQPPREVDESQLQVLGGKSAGAEQQQQHQQQQYHHHQQQNNAKHWWQHAQLPNRRQSYPIQPSPAQHDARALPQSRSARAVTVLNTKPHHLARPPVAPPQPIPQPHPQNAYQYQPQAHARYHDMASPRQKQTTSHDMATAQRHMGTVQQNMGTVQQSLGTARRGAPMPPAANQPQPATVSAREQWLSRVLAPRVQPWQPYYQYIGPHGQHAGVPQNAYAEQWRAAYAHQHHGHGAHVGYADAQYMGYAHSQQAHI